MRIINFINSGKFYFIFSRYLRTLIVAIVNLIIIKKIGLEEYSRLLEVFLLLSFTIYLSFGLKEDYFKRSAKINIKINQKYFFTETIIKIFFLSLLIFPISFFLLNEFVFLTALIGFFNIIRSFFNADLRLKNDLDSISWNNVIFAFTLLILSLFIVSDINSYLIIYCFASALSFLHFLFSCRNSFTSKALIGSIFFKKSLLNKDSFMLLFINFNITAYAGIDRFFIKTYPDLLVGKFQLSNTISEGIAIGLESILMYSTPLLFDSKSKIKIIGLSLFKFIYISIFLIFISLFLSFIITLFLEILSIDSAGVYLFLFFNIISKTLIIFLTAQAYIYSSRNQELLILKRMFFIFIIICFIYFSPYHLIGISNFDYYTIFIGLFLLWVLIFKNNDIKSNFDLK